MKRKRGGWLRNLAKGKETVSTLPLLRRDAGFVSFLESLADGILQCDIHGIKIRYLSRASRLGAHILLLPHRETRDSRVSQAALVRRERKAVPEPQGCQGPQAQGGLQGASAIQVVELGVLWAVAHKRGKRRSTQLLCFHFLFRKPRPAWRERRQRPPRIGWRSWCQRRSR